MAENNSEAAAITDEMLDAAAAEVEGNVNTAETQEGTKTEEQVQEEISQAEEQLAEAQEEVAKIPEEPEDPSARSNLGRKVKAAWSKIDRIEETLAKLTELQQKQYEINSQEVETDFLDLTEEERIERIIERREQAALESVKKYESDYFAGLNEYQIDEDHEEILDEMLANHNIRHSDNGKLDGKLNYANAKLAVRLKKTAGVKQKVNPLNKNTPAKNIGVANSQVSKKSEPALPELDEHAAGFLNHIAKASGEDRAKELHAKITKHDLGSAELKMLQ